MVSSKETTDPLGALNTFQAGRSSLEQPCHFGPILTIKIVIFGPLEPWKGAWNGQKWPLVMLSYVLGCDMAHKTLSRWVALPWRKPCL